MAVKFAALKPAMDQSAWATVTFWPKRGGTVHCAVGVGVTVGTGVADAAGVGDPGPGVGVVVGTGVGDGVGDGDGVASTVVDTVIVWVVQTPTVPAGTLCHTIL